MHRPQHALVMSQPFWSPGRMVSLGLVGLVHVALLYALLSGLAHKYVKAIPPVLQVTMMDEQTPPKEEVAPPKPQLEKPEAPAIAPPDIVIETTIAPPIQQQVMPQAPPPAPPVEARGINNTHTTPPYPEQQRRMGVQGVVHLRIYVSAQGTVSNAVVIATSGSPELDANAVSWVISHWKYKPAMASGEAVASETDANVRYDLSRAV